MLRASLIVALTTLSCALTKPSLPEAIASVEPTAAASQIVVVPLIAAIDAESLQDFARGLGAARGAQYVIIHINSPGGSVYAGSIMAQLIETTPATTVCLVDGYGMSMAMYILASCDIRLMTERSILMIHQAHVVVDPKANPVEVENAQDFQRASTKAYLKFVVSRMKLTYDELALAVSNGRELYWDADMAMAFGAVDQVVPSLEYVIGRLSADQH
jgi:ATP-dependent protease ClpP protease subunit